MRLFLSPLIALLLLIHIIYAFDGEVIDLGDYSSIGERNTKPTSPNAASNPIRLDVDPQPGQDSTQKRSVLKEFLGQFEDLAQCGLKSPDLRVESEPFANGMWRSAFHGMLRNKPVVVKRFQPDGPWKGFFKNETLGRQKGLREMQTELALLRSLAGPHIAEVYGGCYRSFEEAELFEEDLTLFWDAEVRGGLTWFQRVDMALGALDFVEWLDQHGLLFCDFHTTQFGVSKDHRLRIKALDIDAIRWRQHSAAGRALIDVKPQLADVLSWTKQVYKRRPCQNDSICITVHPWCMQGAQFDALGEHKCGKDGYCRDVGPAAHMWSWSNEIARYLLRSRRVVPPDPEFFTEIDALLEKCQQLDPDRRCTMKEARDALHRVMAEYGGRPLLRRLHSEREETASIHAGRSIDADLRVFLDSLNLLHLAPRLAREHIDMRALRELSAQDLARFGVGEDHIRLILSKMKEA